MMDDRELEQEIRAGFHAMRSTDRAQTPDFASTVARARLAVDRPIARAVARSWHKRLLLIGGPALVAAGLAGLFIVPGRLKDREFDRVVLEWSRTDATLHSPTDALLAVPGSEFLGSTPSVTGSLLGKGS